MSGRALFLAELQDVEEWPSTIAEPDVPFVVFTALDASGDIHWRTLTAFAHKLLRQGCAFWTAWGPGCVYVHDAVDQARIAVDLDPEADFDTDATLTTWHDNEPLDEALWYALFCSWNDEREIKALLAIVDPRWREEVERRLRDPEEFDRELVAREEESGEWKVNPSSSRIRLIRWFRGWRQPS